MRRYKGTFDVFFGIEHRMRREEMKEHFNKEANHRWRCAADAARITDETAGSEDRKHTSGGVFCRSRLESGSDRQQKKEQSLPSQEMKEDSPKHGFMSEEVCWFLPYTFGVQKDGRQECADGSSGEAGEGHQASLVGRL